MRHKSRNTKRPGRGAFGQHQQDRRIDDTASSLPEQSHRPDYLKTELGSAAVARLEPDLDRAQCSVARLFEGSDVRTRPPGSVSRRGGLLMEIRTGPITITIDTEDPARDQLFELWDEYDWRAKPLTPTRLQKFRDREAAGVELASLRRQDRSRFTTTGGRR